MCALQVFGLCFLVFTCTVVVVYCVVESKQHVDGIECVRVTECATFAKILHTQPRSSAHFDVVRAAHCGFDHLIEKVWCPVIQSTQKNSQSLDDFPTTTITEKITTETSPLTSPWQKDEDETKRIKTETTSETTTTTEEVFMKNPAMARSGKSDLFPADCGDTITQKIYGGEQTALDEYPWTAILQNRKKKRMVLQCGGVLISKRYVLTAAHCINHKLDSVVLGEYDRRNETDCEFLGTDFEQCAPKPLVLKIEDIVKYPRKPDDPRHYNDIALLRLEKDVEFNDYVKPICLPDKDSKDLEVGTSVTVSGWGRTENGKNSPVKLQVPLNIHSRTNCSKLQGKEVTSKMICALGRDNRDACIGDSGGPMNYFSGSHWTLAGIVSWSLKGCGNTGIPGVYTWVPPYIDWIHQTVY